MISIDFYFRVYGVGIKKTRWNLLLTLQDRPVLVYTPSVVINTVPKLVSHLFHLVRCTGSTDVS